MKLSVYDGMTMGTRDGCMCRVFAPSRWRLDRWVRWFAGVLVGKLTARWPTKYRPRLRARGRIAILTLFGTQRVRVESVDNHALPANIPSPAAEIFDR